MTFAEAKKFLNPNNAIQIGKILKPHGYKGHLTVNLKFDAEILEEESVLVRLNGWLIPFLIDYQETNLYALKPIIKFYEVNDEDFARQLAHKNIFLPKHIAFQYLDTQDLTNLVRFTLTDKTSGKTGIITDYIDNPKNPLIILEIDQQKQLIPTNAATIENIDLENEKVIVSLPEGLI